MPQSRHARKFRGATVALFVAALVALAAAVALVTLAGARNVSGIQWSQWQPTQSGQSGAQEIADYVSPYYRASPAQQLAVVTALNLHNSANPLRIVVPGSGSGSSGGLQALPSSGTVAYSLCGIGSSDCSIGVGTPSTNRLLLLRREALELALYTFKYLSGTQTVVVILPPGRTVQGCTGICPNPHAQTTTKSVDLALAFDRTELGPFLSRPLQETLPEPLPPTVNEMAGAPEAELVSIITAHGIFQERAEQAQDGTNMIVLEPMPAQ